MNILLMIAWSIASLVQAFSAVVLYIVLDAILTNRVLFGVAMAVHIVAVVISIYMSYSYAYNRLIL